MNILIVNAHDIQGGAARAAYRLHSALLEKGVASQMLVQDKSSGDYNIIGPSSKLDMAIKKVRSTLDLLAIKKYTHKTQTLFSPSILPFSGLAKKINKLSPDIVHLHWVNGGMLKIEELAKINAPIVWSLHDMWPFTGGCHYDEECKRFKNECGSCKVLGSHIENDLSKKLFIRKKNTYSKINNLTVIGLSKWLAECATNSYLFKGCNIVNLPNPIDTNIYKNNNKVFSRELWNLPKNKKLILFGAVGATSDPRKGFNQLAKSLKKFKYENVELVVFGSGKPKVDVDFDFNVHYLGNLQDDTSLVSLYSAVDVMIVPSIQENLSNAIMESLSCGTPVVAFNIGGNGDLIDHKETGYLATPFDCEDLAEGIVWVLNSNDERQLSINSRKKIKSEFDNVIVAEKYIELYKKILINN